MHTTTIERVSTDLYGEGLHTRQRLLELCGHTHPPPTCSGHVEPVQTFTSDAARYEIYEQADCDTGTHVLLVDPHDRRRAKRLTAGTYRHCKATARLQLHPRAPERRRHRLRRRLQDAGRRATGAKAATANVGRDPSDT